MHRLLCTADLWRFKIPLNKSNLIYTAVQSQKAVSAYFTSKQTLPFGFAASRHCLLAWQSSVSSPISQYAVCATFAGYI